MQMCFWASFVRNYVNGGVEELVEENLPDPSAT
jgi:hypothetical protein